jgi:hypothetical protein
MEGPVHGVLIAPQAASDADMVSPLAGQFPVRQHPGRYAADARAFVVFIAKPLRQVTVRDVQAFGASLIGAADSTIAAPRNRGRSSPRQSPVTRTGASWP